MQATGSLNNGFGNARKEGSQHPSPNVKTSATLSQTFGQKLSHHVLPKVLVLKAQGRHVM